MKQGTFFKSLAMFATILFTGIIASAQNLSISGTVKEPDGTPIVGATVMVDGTSNGTSTNADGYYSLRISGNNKSITASCIGYKSQTVNIGSERTVNFVLTEDSEMLQDVVVIGYGVQKKRDVTGSISSVAGDELSNRSVENVQQALQGKVSGVQVYSGSGAPGSDPQIRIRGFSSNSSSASNPLYVVDGLKVSSIAYLDPSNIESMEVLKDGASAAIYGAEAGNGVVLITTKSGRKGDGKIFYNFSYGFETLAHEANMMNAEEYVAFETASGNGTLMSQWDGVVDNNWSKTLYGETGKIQHHTIGFESANDKGSFYASATYLDNQGMYYGDKDYLKRITFQINAKYDIKPWLTFSSNNSIEVSKYENTADGINKLWYNSPYKPDPLTPDFWSKDNLPAYMTALIQANGDDMFMKNEDGDYAAVPQYNRDSTNPMTWYYSQDSRHKDFNIRGITAIDLKPFKGFTYTTRLGYTLNSGDYRYYGVPVYFSITPRTNQEYQTTTSTGYRYEWENFANYFGTFGKHFVSAMAGMSYRSTWSNYTGGSTDTFTNNAKNFRYLNYSTSGATDSVSGEESKSASISYFGRIAYTYDDRYNIQLSFRADAYDSSKLSKDKRWGYFPSVSLGWTVSNENFMRNIDKRTMSYLKARASYGENGNVNVLNNYPYASSLTTTDYYPMNSNVIGTISPSSTLANPSLKWETSKQIDVGIDSRFLFDRLNFSVDFYNKNTTGQLITMTPPLSSGTTYVTRNVGKINNHGFEFDLGWKDVIGDFSYSAAANLSTINNKVKDMGNNSRISDGGVVYFDKGQPVWSYYGYKYIGPDPETGAAIYQDTDNSGSIDEKDKVFFGSAIPDIEYGLTLNAAWKGFDLTIFGSGTAGGELFFNSTGPTSNRLAEMWTDCWDVKGAKAKYPHPAVLTDSFMDESSMLMYNGSYFKIKQISLGYTIPQQVIKKIYISNLKFYVSLENFFCFTKYPGMDPETIATTPVVSGSSARMGLDDGNYPVPKTVTLGVNLTF